MGFNYLIVLSSVLLFVNCHDNIVFPCITPNYENACCVSLFECPVLLKTLGTLDPLAISFVKRSICNNFHPPDLMVCCGTLGNFLGHESVTPSPVNASRSTPIPEMATTIMNISPTKPTEPSTSQNSMTVTTESHRDFVKRKLLPTRVYCGLQHTDDRFYNDSATALDEFPWLVDLTYLDDEDDDPYQFLERCNGVLINNRYVLTIGTCANDLARVRLGQYHTSAAVSCIEDPDIPECTEPKYYVDVEKEIHRTKGSIAQHDFALLRLAKKVTYSDFVRPICLPFKEPGDPEMSNSFIFSGWGALEENQQVNKKRVTYNITSDVEKCFKLDKDGLREAASNVSVLCLIPKKDNVELACTGDEGGPLMNSHNFQWFVEALITKVYDSFDESKVTGVRKNSTQDSCSNTLPISSIKITPDILDWIIDNIQP